MGSQPKLDCASQQFRDLDFGLLQILVTGRLCRECHQYEPDQEALNLEHETH